MSTQEILLSMKRAKQNQSNKCPFILLDRLDHIQQQPKVKDKEKNTSEKSELHELAKDICKGLNHNYRKSVENLLLRTEENKDDAEKIRIQQVSCYLIEYRKLDLSYHTKEKPETPSAHETSKPFEIVKHPVVNKIRTAKEKADCIRTAFKLLIARAGSKAISIKSKTRNCQPIGSSTLKKHSPIKSVSDNDLDSSPPRKRRRVDIGEKTNRGKIVNSSCSPDVTRIENNEIATKKSKRKSTDICKTNSAEKSKVSRSINTKVVDSTSLFKTGLTCPKIPLSIPISKHDDIDRIARSIVLDLSDRVALDFQKDIDSSRYISIPKCTTPTDGHPYRNYKKNADKIKGNVLGDFRADIFRRAAWHTSLNTVSVLMSKLIILDLCNQVIINSVDEKLFVKEKHHMEDMDRYFMRPDFSLPSFNSEASEGTSKDQLEAVQKGHSTNSDRAKKSKNPDTDNSVAASLNCEQLEDSSLSKTEDLTPPNEREEIVYTISDTSGHSRSTCLETSHETPSTCLESSGNSHVSGIDEYEKNTSENNTESICPDTSSIEVIEDENNMSGEDLKIFEEKFDDFCRYRVQAAKTVLLGNRCDTCQRNSRKTCDNCVSLWRCIFCSRAFKGSYSKIKGHINRKHLDRVEMPLEEKREYLRFDRLICRWPYLKYFFLGDVLA